MKTQHTKGEWEVKKGLISTYIIAEDVARICTMMSTDSQIDKANAKLVAAAPNLLKSLEMIIEYYNKTQSYPKGHKNYDPSDEMNLDLQMIRADKIIKKATE